MPGAPNWGQGMTDCYITGDFSTAFGQITFDEAACGATILQRGR